jgi:predicted transcriptional regulator
MPYIAQLKGLRLGLGMSQAELARMARVDRATVARCEEGYSITELSCAKIIIAMKEEARARHLEEPDPRIEDGGVRGSFLSRLKKKRG